jgi:hypothetical protein
LCDFFEATCFVVLCFAACAVVWAGLASVLAALATPAPSIIAAAANAMVIEVFMSLAP